jgi:hypothetical protein
MHRPTGGACWLLSGVTHEPLVITATVHSAVRHRRDCEGVQVILTLICNGVLVLSAIGMGYVVLAGKGYGGK